MVDPKTNKTKVIFGLSAIPDQLTYQAFSFLIFTYYFTVVKINMIQMWIAYVIWGIWNATNDPLFGALSDRTNLRWGKRRSFILIAIVPLCLMMIFLFTAPLLDDIINFIYFLIVIIIFEGVYTLYSVNVNALFPEMFPNERERAKTNLAVKGFTVFALILATLLPTIIIPDLVPDTPAAIALISSRYVLTGVVIAIVTGIAAVPFILRGIKEKKEIQEEFEKRPSYFDSLKISLKNKTFIKFTVANTAIWYIFGLLPTILPLYGEHVLKVPTGESLLIGLSLMLAFIVAAVIFPVHKKIGEKIGMRNGLILTCVVWIGTLSGYLFLFADPTVRIISIFITGMQGFGLSGAMYYVDILIGDVIDEDEMRTGVRRSGSYYGINAFINRLSIILVITSITLVFSGTGWANDYVPVTSNPELTILGLKVLIFVLPAIALVIAVIFLKWYGLHGERLEEMRKKLIEQRTKKT
ncbi:MAG: MFS transporter [Candidatus Helarchaeota archaeon]